MINSGKANFFRQNSLVKAFPKRVTETLMGKHYLMSQKYFLSLINWKKEKNSGKRRRNMIFFCMTMHSAHIWVVSVSIY